jgi:ATP-dependent protease Clp ATPase subunit
MKITDEKIPNPEEVEKEITRFLAKKFGGTVRIATPLPMLQEDQDEKTGKSHIDNVRLNFDLKPEDLIAYLDQYIIKQDEAKAVLSTKICTHYNRIKNFKNSKDLGNDLFSGIKNNVLMLGPTGVGRLRWGGCRGSDKGFSEGSR